MHPGSQVAGRGRLHDSVLHDRSFIEVASVVKRSVFHKEAASKEGYAYTFELSTRAHPAHKHMHAYTHTHTRTHTQILTHTLTLVLRQTTILPGRLNLVAIYGGTSLTLTNLPCQPLATLKIGMSAGPQWVVKFNMLCEYVARRFLALHRQLSTPLMLGCRS